MPSFCLCSMGRERSELFRMPDKPRPETSSTRSRDELVGALIPKIPSGKHIKQTGCYWKWPSRNSGYFPIKRVIFHSYGTVYQRVLLKWGHPCGDEMFFPAPMAHPAAKSGHSLKKETPETNFLLEKSGQFDICASSSQALRSSTLVGGFNHLEKY